MDAHGNIILTYDKNRQIFICKCKYNDREIPYRANFTYNNPDEAFNPKNKIWWTQVTLIAYRLREYADGLAKKQLDSLFIKISPFDGTLNIIGSNNLYPHQINAIRFALERNRSYLALDAGLGKTACALITAYTLKYNFIYICPPCLVLNVQDEIEKWIGTSRLANLVIPDSLLNRKKTIEEIKSFLVVFQNTILIVDESHRYKNADSIRSKMLLGFENKKGTYKGIVQYFDKIILLSGTPMPNRPIELFPILNRLSPDSIDFMSEYDYGHEYCNAKRTAFGYDYSGACNMKKLYNKITEKFMLRIRKKDVLKDLPPKIEEMVFIGENESKEITDMNRSILKIYSPHDLIKQQITSKFQRYDGEEIHLATYRRVLGIYKAPFAIKFIKECLEDNDESYLIFAIHKEVISLLHQSLKDYNPYVITGSTPREKRVPLIKKFSNDKTSRLLIGNIMAAGIGLNIVKASRVIKVEFSWCDKDNEQATDRAHRIGQTNRVLDQYLVFKNSLDRRILEVIFNKRRIGVDI